MEAKFLGAPDQAPRIGGGGDGDTKLHPMFLRRAACVAACYALDVMHSMSLRGAKQGNNLVKKQGSSSPFTSLYDRGCFVAPLLAMTCGAMFYTTFPPRNAARASS